MVEGQEARGIVLETPEGVVGEGKRSVSEQKQ